MKDNTSKFPDRDRYIEEIDILYHINRESSKEYKAVVMSKQLVPTKLKEMYDSFGHFDIGKTYSCIKRYYYLPKVVKHIQSQSCFCAGMKS